ncbi:hypothetical protein Hypma_008366 [Hypsizygus marmoreus]|uniref:Uncharacterized protein n=1 Tax=Hypsizygus marmoreus TaxID=39966 RepID=A0A369JR59_HYPMA|nr:hypothetical protein Hypma_008366 [Hypsizygus marmoreus]
MFGVNGKAFMRDTVLPPLVQSPFDSICGVKIHPLYWFSGCLDLEMYAYVAQTSIPTALNWTRIFRPA